MIRPDHIQYLKYVQNTGGNATVSGFDDDWEPIGPMLRKELMPTYIVENPDGRLALTEAGSAAIVGSSKCR